MANNQSVSKRRNTESEVKEGQPFWDKIDHRLMTVISFIVGILFWAGISSLPHVGGVLVGPVKVFQAFVADLHNGGLYKNISISLFRVLTGFLLGLVVAIPVAFLMGWYSLFRNIVKPWIQFFRTIPPIALIPLVIVAFGVGEGAKITVIFVASFLVMVISIYQGVRNVDPTLIKAAKVLGATDKDIFFEVVVPASFPYILVGIRLGLASALTTLVAAELTGASAGLGDMIEEASIYFNMDQVLLGIVLIGILGFILDRGVLFMERKLTGWQEVRKS